MESIKEKAKKYAEEHCHAEPWLAYQAGYMEGFAAGSKNDKNTTAYTYEQMATLNLQLQGLITAKDEAYCKIVTENGYLRNKIRLIEKVLNNE